MIFLKKNPLKKKGNLHSIPKGIYLLNDVDLMEFVQIIKDMKNHENKS